MNTNPIIGFLRTIWFYITGRVRFVKASFGKEFIGDDGEKFKVFRQVIIKPRSKNTPTPKATFIVRFEPKMNIERNKRFSRLPIMVFMGFKGFRSKYWMADETMGICQGVYEWQTLQDAENYSRSIAVRFMTKRSVAGSVKLKFMIKNKNYETISDSRK